MMLVQDIVFQRMILHGSMHAYMQGAVIAPSEEDSQTFTINGANGEIYKLRGQDAKERQFWVSRLRREVEFCTNQSFTSNEVYCSEELIDHGRG